MNKVTLILVLLLGLGLATGCWSPVDVRPRSHPAGSLSRVLSLRSSLLVPLSPPPPSFHPHDTAAATQLRRASLDAFLDNADQPPERQRLHHDSAPGGPKVILSEVPHDAPVTDIRDPRHPEHEAWVKAWIRANCVK